MKYPDLVTTPIKETIFSVSYQEIIDKKCFEEFINLDTIKSDFNDIRPSINQNVELKKDGKISISEISDGFHLKSDNEILQLKKGLFSLHYINGYRKFDSLLEAFIKYWGTFDKITQDDLTITDFSVRYINVIETDSENQPTHLVQLYPRKSSDRDVSNFQNSIEFRYKENSDYLVNAVSTKYKDIGVILDISVKGTKDKVDSQNFDLIKAFKPLQEIKNKAFFDSITARALLKYIQPIK
nr:TIGR04255 family protein [uncultured Allomuricauda sp.]